MLRLRIVFILMAWAIGGMYGISPMVGNAHAEVFLEEGFESASPQTFLSQYYGSLNASSVFSVQTSIKASGLRALQRHFLAGTGNGGEYATQHFGDSAAGPIYPTGAGQHYQDIFIQFKLYYSPGYDWSAGNNKIMIIGTQDDRSHSNVCCNPWVSHYITILAGNTGSRGFFNTEANNKRSATGQWIGLSPNVSGYSSTNRYFIESGKWYTIEIHKKLNDSGQSNGIFEMWINGLKVTDYSNILYRIPWDGTCGSNFAYGTNFAMLTTYINNAAPQNQDIFYDDIKISTTYIGSLPVLDPPPNFRVVQ